MGVRQDLRDNSTQPLWRKEGEGSAMNCQSHTAGDYCQSQDMLFFDPDAALAGRKKLCSFGSIFEKRRSPTKVNDAVGI